MIAGDQSGELATGWWQSSLLTFVQETQVAVDSERMVLGTPDDVSAFPLIRIDTVTTNPISPPAWTIYLDNSIMVLPFSGEFRDSAPTLGVTRVGDTIIPTVTWAHAVGAANHDPVIARFVNGAWTPPESIAMNLLEDSRPRIAQDDLRTVHATWRRVAGDRGLDGGVFYANEPADYAVFSSEERVSRSGELARNPSVGVSSGDVFIAYESERGDTVPRVILSRRVQRQQGAGNGFRHRVVGRTSGEMPAEPELASLGEERLLLTWVASPSRIGFTILSSGRWSTTSYEPIGSSETAGEVRRRIAISLQGREESEPQASEIH